MPVSEAETTPQDEPAFDRLEEAAVRLVRTVEELRTRVQEAEEKNAELSELVRRFTGDEAEADRLLSRLTSLQEQNRDLRSRMDEGRDGVDRLLARIRFLEEQR